jgi:hypothetical protein
MDRTLLTRAGWILAIILGGYLLVDKLRTPAAPPPAATSLVAPTAAPEAGAPATVQAPSTYATPAFESSPGTAPAATGPATPSPQATASASASPSPDAAAEAVRAEQERRLRADLDAAKAKADSLTATANSECPELKSGEQRHPGAIYRCQRLRNEAAQAVADYESLKKQAQAAGINVQ